MISIVLVLFVLCIVCVLGYLPAIVLLPEEQRPMRWVVAPLVGVVIAILVSLNAYRLGVPVRRVPLPLLAAALLAIALYTFRTRRRTQASANLEPGIAAKPALLAGAAALLIAGWPGFYTGFDTYMGYANPDAYNYQTSADEFLNGTGNHAFSIDSYHPGSCWVYWARTNHHRGGGDVFLAFVSAALNTSAKQAYFVAMSCLVLQIPLGVYFFAYFGLGLRQARAWLPAVLASADSLLFLIYYQELLGNVTGLCIMIPALAAILACLRQNGWRAATLAGIWTAGLLATYPEMLVLMGPLVGMVVVYRWSQGDWQIVKNAAVAFLVIVLTILLINPYYGYYGIKTLLPQTQSFPGGDTYAFAFSWGLLPVTFGLLPYPLLAGSRLLAILVWIAVGALGLACLLVLMAWIIWGKGEAVRNVFRPAFIVMLLLGMYLGLRLHYSYGLFKLILYGHFLVLTLLAIACVDIWEGQAPAPRMRAFRYAGPCLGFLVIACNAGSSGWYGAVSLANTSFGIVNATGLSGDRSLNELEGLGHVIRPDESVMIDCSRDMTQMWAAYGLRNLRVSLFSALGYFVPWEKSGVDFRHNYADRYVLRESPRLPEIIVWEGTRRPVWRSNLFSLYELQDYVALGANWYGLEGEPGHSFRWLNNDGEILLINPLDKQYQFSCTLSPGPGVQGSERHVSVVANGKRVYRQVIRGSAAITTPLFDATCRQTHIVLHIEEQPQRVSFDTRLLNVSVAGVLLRSERRLRELKAAENPSQLTMADWARYSSRMAGVFGDAWCGPVAEFTLGNTPENQALEIAGEVPAFAHYRFPVHLAVQVNGKPLPTIVLTGPGPFRTSLNLPAFAHRLDTLKIGLHAAFSFVPKELGMSDDTRALSYRPIEVKVLTASQDAAGGGASSRDPECYTSLRNMRVVSRR